ncbi:hypothetical protein Tco_0776398, partial [Tanacetum coccineum]
CRTMSTATRSEMTQEAINELLAKRVEEAPKAYDAAKNPKTETEMENEKQDKNVEANVSNGNGNGNGNGNPNVNNKDDALTWWNLHKSIVGVDAAYAMMWKALMKLMTQMVPKEEDQVEKYIRGLLDNIQGNSILSLCYLFRNPFSSTTMGDENPIRTLGDYSKPSHEGYINTIELPVENNVVPLRSDTIRRTIDQLASGKLHDLNAEESWALLEDLALYDNESWSNPRDFVKPVKAITLPRDVPSTSDSHLIEL